MIAQHPIFLPNCSASNTDREHFTSNVSLMNSLCTFALAAVTWLLGGGRNALEPGAPGHSRYDVGETMASTTSCIAPLDIRIPLETAPVTGVRNNASAHVGTGVVHNRQLDGAMIIVSCTEGPCGLA